MTAPFTHDPTRLLEDHASSSLRRDLELARAARVDYPSDAGLARFEATLAGASTLPAGGSLAGLAVLRWFLGVTAVLSLTLGIAWLSSPSPPQPAMAVAPPTSRIEPSPTPLQPAMAATSPTPQPMPAASPSSPLATATAQSPPMPAAPPSGSTPPKPDSPTASKPASQAIASLDEARLIDAARKSLAEDPAHTLELTEQAAERFPAGAMIEERRGYAILALITLDRPKAEQLASEYLERWPKGPLARRIRDGLGIPALLP